ncbi:hypothetical protein ACS0TY_013901 [Phlomoides rotata]
MDRKIEAKKEEIQRLDVLDEIFGLDEGEMRRRQDILGDLMMESKGDVNSSFFHNWVKCR